MEPIVKNLIILGTGNGNDIARFIRKTPSSEDWNIYGFEPGFDTFLHLEHRFKDNKNVHLVNAAANIFDGIIKLYECGKNLNNGRSINPLKYNVLSHYKEVEAEFDAEVAEPAAAVAEEDAAVALEAALVADVAAAVALLAALVA